MIEQMKTAGPRRWLAFLLLAFLVGVGGATVALAGQDDDAKQMRAGASQAEEAPGVQFVNDSDLVPVGKSPIKGQKNAPVTIVAFEDFQCPFCARVQPTLKQLLTDYKGKVRVVFKHNPLSFHKDAALAAEASMAAGEQGKFWQYHDLLFKNQKALKRPDLESYAKQLGLNMKRFNAALDNGKFKKHIADDQALANKTGARGTPNFFINGIKFVGAKPLADFKKVIDDELKVVGKKNARVYKARVAANFQKDPPAAPRNNRPPSKDTTVYKVPVGDSPILGSKNALVTIVTFQDFQCPFCSRSQNTLREIMLNNKGKIRIVFKHLPLPFHKEAMPAAQAAVEAQRQGKFWEFHDLLFQNQKALGKEELAAYAQRVGMDANRMLYALDQETHLDRVKEDTELASKLGARGTPHFFVNGRRLSGAQPVASFQALIDETIANASALINTQGLRGDALYEAIIANGAEKFEAAAPAPAKPPADTVHKIAVGKSPTKGPARAKVTITIFSNFQCPFCARSTATLKELEKTYKGKIRFVFKNRPLPFHKDARPAAIAALAAHRQGKFWEFHDLLFQDRNALKHDNFLDYARKLKLNIRRFEKDLKDPALEQLIKDDEAIAQTVGASGTPTFYINGRKLVGAQPAAAFEKIIDEELAK